ncbi:putative haloacid dehalogenase-like hydrolase [Lyophyllum shimeji]|uniref:Haloacid dehalogenase-like hydrolase n=1 Tax=Lyophyllum shimeji TaxID=47721 RepID=A0A9P3PG21_LYOSH|nr:putative haloacid dehalogenase-like hydrolase [Lyophyllum shimeji]
MNSALNFALFLSLMGERFAGSRDRGFSMKLEGVDAFLFDVFGTVFDWRTSVEAELDAIEIKYNLNIQSSDDGWKVDFAQEWRTKFFVTAHAIVAGTPGTSNMDELNRQILDRMLDTPGSRWGFLSNLLNDAARQELNGVWHRLRAWDDSSPGLHALKKHCIIATLSNGNVRLLVDLAKQSDLPWDAVFSTGLFDTYKPDPKTYISAARHLSLPTARCAMVAAHAHDLRAAAALGMRTVCIPRPREDLEADAMKPKAEGGEVDLVVRSIEELARIVAEAKSERG